MQIQTYLRIFSVLALSTCWMAGVHAQNVARIAVTDLGYTNSVSQYFEAGTFKGNSQMHANKHSASVSHQSSGTYVSGQYSYMEQRELGSFTNDIKGAILKGTKFKLVQGKGFDAGNPQPTKAEQVLNQLQTGKVTKPTRQPEVKDIIARIKKGEFNGADYVLFGTLSHIEFIDQFSPLQGTTNATMQYGLALIADFSLINTKSYEIKAAFSAQGSDNDTKLISNRGDIVSPNRVKVMLETSQSLATNVFEQLTTQLGILQGAQTPQSMPIAQQPDQVLILK